MSNSKAGTIKGLSIAVLILSILCLMGSLLIIGIFGIGGAAISNPEFADQITGSIEADPNTMAALENSGFTADDIPGIGGLVMVFGGTMGIILLVLSLIPLIAAILGIRNCRKPEKLGGAFVWAILGAIASLLCGNYISLILLVISAVCIHGERNRAVTTIPYGQPHPGYSSPAGYAQQPPQPIQPPQPGQPGQPQQPEQH